MESSLEIDNLGREGNARVDHARSQSVVDVSVVETELMSMTP